MKALRRALERCLETVDGCSWLACDLICPMSELPGHRMKHDGFPWQILRQTQRDSKENFRLLGGGKASKSSKVLIKSKASVAASRASRAHSQWLQPNRSHGLLVKAALLLLWAHLKSDKSGSLLSLGGSAHAVQCRGYLIQRDGL